MYVRSKIKPGFRVRACQTYQDVYEGDEGVYRQHNESTPPVQVRNFSCIYLSSVDEKRNPPALVLL